MTIQMTQSPDVIERLAEIQKRVEATTPGPWAWHGNERVREVYLTQEYGNFVMKFWRWGTQGAQPVFPDDFAMRAVAQNGWLQTDHNGDILAIDHPNARFITSSRDDVPWLLALVDRLMLEKSHAWKEVYRTREYANKLLANVDTSISGYWLNDVTTAPDDPSFPCDACGRDVRDCTCPDGADREYRAAWREWVRNGELDAPEDGDAVYAAGFEALVAGALPIDYWSQMEGEGR